MIIRKATMTDFPNIWNVISRIVQYPAKCLVNLWDFRYPTKEIIQEDIELSHSYVYEENEIILGYFALGFTEEEYLRNVPWQDNHFITVHRLCVQPSVWGSGVGQNMMQFIKEYAVINGFSSIRLDTYSKNDHSQKLYLKQGFEFRDMLCRPKGEYFAYELFI